MSERLRQIKFGGFRGLPDYTCDLKGRSLLICGGNGTGKSAVIDGLEFFFGGSVQRFHGEGTGNISHNDSVRHVKAKGDAVVELVFMPANETASRRLGASIEPATLKSSVKQCIASCGEPASFILRRAQILGFISSQDSDRYQRLVQLLGLWSVHATQKAFVQATQTAHREAEDAHRRLENLFQAYADRDTGWLPKTAQSIRERCAALLKAVGVDVEATPDGLVSGEPLLEKKRSPATKRRLDAIALALGTLSVQFGEEWKLLVDQINENTGEMKKLLLSTQEAEQLPVIAAGFEYFSKRTGLEKCPLCEQPLLKGYQHVFSRLKRRRETLKRLQEEQNARRRLLDRLIASVQRLTGQSEADLRHEKELEAELVGQLKDAVRALSEWIEALRAARDELVIDPIDAPAGLNTLQSMRTAEVERLKDAQSKLAPEGYDDVERVSAFIKRYFQDEKDLAETENAARQYIDLAKQAQTAEEAFTKAREAALKSVLAQMADTVLDYYKRLHDADGAECTEVAFEPTGRARAGGLRFVIEFLGLASNCDPRAYLSDGHLDSLGLCLYLATARLFNQPGMLLVLDDVLTSADREHRHRVADLLLEEFSDFQLIITTNDEHWFNILQAKAQARGEQKDWRFQKIARWSLDTGPESAAFEGTWDYIQANLDENAYRQLGGPLRLVLEDFMKRVAEKIEMNIAYRRAANYTAGDFHMAGLVKELRTRLLQAAPQDESAIKKELARAFGDDNLINFLSHDNPGRLEVTLQQTRDFVEGLQELTKLCETYKLIRGITV